MTTLKWEVTNTGGGCMAFRADKAGFHYLITAHGDPSLPNPQESADLGIYNADNDDVYFGAFNHSLAAANFAEGWKFPTLRTWLERCIKNPASSRWLIAFDCSRQGSQVLLDCAEDSVCGVAIKRVIRAADELLAAMGADPSAADSVVTAVRAECNCIYFG